MTNETAVEKLAGIIHTATKSALIDYDISEEVFGADVELYASDLLTAKAILAAIQADPMAYVKPKPLEWRMGFSHAMGMIYHIAKDGDLYILSKHQGSAVTKSAYGLEDAAKRGGDEDLCKRVKELF